MGPSQEAADEKRGCSITKDDFSSLESPFSVSALLSAVYRARVGQIEAVPRAYDGSGTFEGRMLTTPTCNTGFRRASPKIIRKKSYFLYELPNKSAAVPLSIRVDSPSQQGCRRPECILRRTGHDPVPLPAAASSTSEPVQTFP